MWLAVQLGKAVLDQPALERVFPDELSALRVQIEQFSRRNAVTLVSRLDVDERQLRHVAPVRRFCVGGIFKWLCPFCAYNAISRRWNDRL